MGKIAPIFFSFFIMAGCSTDHPNSQKNVKLEQIPGRHQESRLVYQAQVPSDWIRQNPSSDFLTDTTKPLCEFSIQEGEDTIRITIHSFPSLRAEERIPPMAQIMRWKRQLKDIDPTTVEVIPQAYAGFVGFLFMGSGRLKGELAAVMGWSMQISPEHYRVLSKMGAVTGDNHFQQMSADYTIKATGPKKLMEKHKQVMVAFARSFELIEEIPVHS